MHIMLMAQCYAPENVSAAVLITELATDLVKSGHQVTVITGAPNYPYGRVFAGYRNPVYQVEWLDGVRVVRTWSYISPQKVFWRRMLHYGTYSASAFYGGLLAGKPDILLSYSPPLPLGLSAWMLSRIWQVPWVLQLEDLYPEAAVAAGVLQNRTAIRFFTWMENFIYKRATHISVISSVFRQSLLEKGIAAEKITLIPNWADPEIVRPLPKENAFRIQHGNGSKLIVMYAGNLGITSSLEDVIDAAVILKEDPNIRFLIIGEGVKERDLKGIARANKLENIAFLPYQPRESFPEVLAAADVNLVTLNCSSSLSSLPSKVFNIMASARPILAVTPPESELAWLVEATNCGISVAPEHPELLAGAILNLKQQSNQLLEEMGKNGRLRLETMYSRAGCIQMYEQMFLKLRPAKPG
jgi:colanic acid biosynthesis glycosyl transferase WcaI